VPSNGDSQLRVLVWFFPSQEITIMVAKGHPPGMFLEASDLLSRKSTAEAPSSDNLISSFDLDEAIDATSPKTLAVITRAALGPPILKVDNIPAHP
jgi:hypothetical protein